MEISEIINSKERTLFLVSPAELSEFAESVAIKILSGQIKQVQEPRTERPVSQKEAIQFLGKSRQTLSKWRKEGRITGHKLGGRIYFLKSELLAAMQ
jgi:hypothetical protein